MLLRVFERLELAPSSNTPNSAYCSSIQEIGDFLSIVNASMPQSRPQTNTQPALTSTLITVVIHIHEAHTSGTPTLADVEFGPLDTSSFALTCDRDSPLPRPFPIRVAINADRGLKLAGILPHLKRNNGLQNMVKMGQLEVMVGECDMDKSEGKSCFKERLEEFEVYRFGGTC